MTFVIPTLVCLHIFCLIAYLTENPYCFSVSAKATQCLPHASEIEVSTGPFFGGRIAVEAADGERCAIDGEPNSPRDTYTLRIDHTQCGSQVNDTTVATFVLVQENLPILTHSTRRYRRNDSVNVYNFCCVFFPCKFLVRTSCFQDIDLRSSKIVTEFLHKQKP